MSINIHTEQILTIREAANFLPTRPHWSTVKRWMKKGVRGIKLESTFIGDTRVTSKEAIDRFFADRKQLSDPQLGTRSTPAQRRRKLAKLNAELIAEGL